MFENEIRRTFIVADIHFGVRTNSLEWLEIHKEYFKNFLIPLINNNKKSGDVLFILGDIFESRQTINILVLNEALKIIQELAEILPVYIIVGNHDSYKKYSTDINSTVIFKNIKNVHIYDKDIILQTAFGQKLLMMPWQESKEKEIEVITNNSFADYLFCHTDFIGLKYNKKVNIEEGLDIDKVLQFKKVYSGHIHLAQEYKNIKMIGCCFPLTRNDIGDKKRAILLDFETETEQVFFNDYSPKFLKYDIKFLLEKTFEEFEKEVQNNLVDIILDNFWVTVFPLTNLLDNVKGYRKMGYVLSSQQKDTDEYDDDTLDGNMNIEELTELYINDLNYSEDFKKLLLTTSSKYYKKAKKFLEEKTQNEIEV